MARTQRHQEPILNDRERIDGAIARARQSSFFALIATLERLTPDAARVGGDGPVAEEVLRFRHDPSMGFAASDVVEASIREVARRPSAPREGRREVIEVISSFLGVTGAVSPLPLHIPAEVAQDPSSRGVQRDFLDIFHHRLLSLLYRMWMRYHLGREAVSDGSDLWTKRVAALAGFDIYDASTSLPVTPSELLQLAPLLAGGARTAHALELALEIVLRGDLELDGRGEPIRPRIEQLVGGFVVIDEAQRMRLSRHTSVLGRTSVLGGRARDRASSFAIDLRLRPEVDRTAYMMKGQKLELIRGVVINLLSEPLDCELRVTVGSGGQAAFTLEGRRASARSALGRQTWLRGRADEQRFTVSSVTSRSFT
jgi:type VI secretion system protein ImpH